jgi:hypothetical protein
MHLDLCDIRSHLNDNVSYSKSSTGAIESKLGSYFSPRKRRSAERTS